jgi:hypothetical protein
MKNRKRCGCNGPGLDRNPLFYGVLILAQSVNLSLFSKSEHFGDNGMEWEYWFLDMPKLRQGDIKTKIRNLELNGWKFVANGGGDSSEVLIFKRQLNADTTPVKEGCLMVSKKYPVV